MGNYELGENICKQCDSRGYNFQNKKSSSCNSITKTPNKKKEQKPIQTFLHRRYTAGQEAHEKMLNITNFLRNANQNYNEDHFMTVRMPIIKSLTDNKCWRECGEKGTLLHCW